MEIGNVGNAGAIEQEPTLWVDIATGIVLIAVGLAIWVNPAWFLPLVAVAVIGAGARVAWRGFAARRGDGLDGVRVVVGLLTVVFGAALLLYPDKTAPLLLYLVSGWAIVLGVFIALLGFQNLASISGKWEIVVGVCLTMFGIATWPVSGQPGPPLVYLSSFLLVLTGIVQIGGAKQRQSQTAV
jgi:uncharacterized membrane protein HdeD (DUF308 family)